MIDLNSLDIHNIVQRREYKRRREIAFKIGDIKYDLLLYKDEDNHVFSPDFVLHRSDNGCSFCDESKDFTRCSALEQNIQALFHRLIEHPSIRLEWLFIPYSDARKEG